MLSQLKQNDEEFAAATVPPWRPTIVRSSLWEQTAMPQADWAAANPEKLMTYLMVAQSDFDELRDVLT